MATIRFTIWESLRARKYIRRSVRHVALLRVRAWLKVNNLNEQELVIGGFTPHKNSRPPFGSIAVACYDDGKLLASLHKQFLARKIDDCPFRNLPTAHKSRFGQGMSDKRDA